MKSVTWVVAVYGGFDLRNRILLRLEWKSEGVMDGKSGDGETSVDLLFH